MKVRYVIQNHPGLFTELMIEYENGNKVQLETRKNWAVLREECRRTLEDRGITPTITKPDHDTEVFPWVEQVNQDAP